MVKRNSLKAALQTQRGVEKRNKLQHNAHPQSSNSQQAQATPINLRRAQQHQLIPFDKDDRILFIGEGNFSFSASCVENHLEHAENVTATSYDSLAVLLEKYPEAVDNVAAIKDCCGTVRHSIDAMFLHKSFSGEVFDVVIFMFPHVAAGIADEDRNILPNQKMLSSFFKNVQPILSRNGIVAVTLATGPTYDKWDLRGLAKAQGLLVKTSNRFDGRLFPGYEHRRTQGHYNSANHFSGGRGEVREARWTLFSQQPNTSRAKESRSDGAFVRNYDSSSD